MAFTVNTEQVYWHNAALSNSFPNVKQCCAFGFSNYSPLVTQSMRSTKPHFHASNPWLFDRVSALLRLGCKSPCVSFSCLLVVLLFCAFSRSKPECSILPLTIWLARCLFLCCVSLPFPKTTERAALQLQDEWHSSAVCTTHYFLKVERQRIDVSETILRQLNSSLNLLLSSR